MKKYLYTNKDGRQRLVVVTDDGKYTSISYPRILMEKKLGSPLKPNEDVHHIDGNKSNNNLNNLEVVTHGEHQKYHNPQKYFDKEVVCDICGKLFIFTAKQQSNLSRDISRGKHRGITCSKRCAYFFGKQEQVKSNLNAECGLNGEPSPNGNTVPNT